MLLGILYVYSALGTTCVYALHSYDFSLEEQSALWVLFFIALAVKVPVVPLHVWLPEAHVEAPTSGSVILAGVLLKLGGYGLIRFVLPVLPHATAYYAPLVMTIASVSIVYSSLTTLRQVDLKKIIAYSSVAHMNLGLLGVFALNTQGLEGSVLLMLGHGLVSSALFLLVGVLYDRHHTRLVRYYGGLAQVMPAFSGMFLSFSLANMGLPGTGNFVGEALVLVGAFDRSPGAAFAAAWGMVFSAGYSLWLYNRVSLGALKVRYISRFVDLTGYELGVLALLLSLTILMGVYPYPVLSAIHVSVSSVLRV